MQIKVSLDLIGCHLFGNSVLDNLPDIKIDFISSYVMNEGTKLNE